MSMSRAQFVDRPATALAKLVHTKVASPVQIVQAHLDQIASVDGNVGAFQLVRAHEALAEAEALSGRGDLAELPLAGVPVAIKDNVPVAGEPMRRGSAATSTDRSRRDHEVVRRLRAAGAIVIGKTKVPELSAWPTTDGPFGTARNPWNPQRTTGGSSGGSAAAVAAAMVPMAHGSDGLGSIRIPAACCGLVGMKPGLGVVPSELGVNSWSGLAANGCLTTTVDDAALMLSVLADKPGFRDIHEPDRPLRIAVSTAAPVRGVRVEEAFKAAAVRMGKLLQEAGHHVVVADPPYSFKIGVETLARWVTSVAEDAVGLSRRRLERRTRAHVLAGRVVRRLRRSASEDRARWRLRLDSFFSGYDLVLTPTLARSPLRADGWSQRSWTANLWASINYAPFTSPWNLAGYPAASIPAGQHSDGMPLSVQLASTAGRETLILSVAKQLETLSPWPRHAPLANV